MSRGAGSAFLSATGSRRRCAICMSAYAISRRGQLGVRDRGQHGNPVRRRRKLLCARHVVVAVSHGLPALPHGIPPTLTGKRGLLENPWNIDRLAEIPP